ncbi:MarR family transcriptional regulator [Nocardia sp. NPDC051832]|uniref:MarR family winged helix-turn-helix transcriptional regulator n=1 Tax=Nocardia sp. NPDC051832 TaxID=3155673 RepID=UPI003428A5A6
MSRDIVDVIAEAWRKELPEVAGLELELSKRAARLSALLGERVEAELARLGLTKAEYEILAVLRATGKPYRLRPTELSQRLLLTSGGTSNLLRRLAAAKRIDREPDPFDARSSWVSLTPQGVTDAEAAVKAAGRAQAALLQAVPDGTARAAADALREVLVALGDQADQQNSDN